MSYELFDIKDKDTHEYIRDLTREQLAQYVLGQLPGHDKGGNFRKYEPLGEHDCTYSQVTGIRRLSDLPEDEWVIRGARLDSGSEEDTHSVMEMCMRNGIPVITAVQKAPGKKETEKLCENVKNYIATVPLDMSPEEAKKFAEEHTTESQPEELKKDDA